VQTSPLSTRLRIGVGIAALLGLLDCTSLFFPPTEPGQVGPPVGILVVGTLLGVATLVAVLVAWRTGRRTAIRVTALTRIVSVLLALPAFIFGAPAEVQQLVAVFVVISAIAVALMLAPERRRTTTETKA
jgi:presenilin-like A22 family membrane protease